MLTTEIAELTKKQHKHVLTDTRKMLDELGLRSADFSADVPDRYGRPQPAFRLPRRETMVLVTGYSIPLRAAVIDRLDELEAALRKAQAATLDSGPHTAAVHCPPFPLPACSSPSAPNLARRGGHRGLGGREASRDRSRRERSRAAPQPETSAFFAIRDLHFPFPATLGKSGT